MLEPILVMQSEASYQLVCGEQRLRACRRLSMQSIPARVLESTLSKLKVLEYKMSENLHRAEMNPIREANYYYEYLRARIDVKDVREAQKVLMTLGRGRRGSYGPFVETVSTVERISGKTSRSIQNYLSLLLLPDVIKRAIIEEKISVSKGYEFAKHIKHPELLSIFKMALIRPMSKEDLIACFENAERSEDQKSYNVAQLHGLLDDAKRIMKKCMHEISRGEADELLSALNDLHRYIEEATGKAVVKGIIADNAEVAELNSH